MKNILFLLAFFPVLLTAQVGNLTRSDLDLGDDEDYSSFTMMDENLKNYTVFFVGENHLFRQINDSLKFKFVKYLHKKAGVKNVVIEFGFIRGYLINKYILESDTLAYRLLKLNSGPTFLRMYENFHDYNLTLPDTARIKFIGIDVERFFELPVEYMCKLLPDDTIPAPIKMHLESLQGLAVFLEKKQSGNIPLRSLIKSYSSYETVKAYIENYEQNDSVYRVYLGENFELFDKIVESLRGTIIWTDYNKNETTQGYVYREQCMEDNFMEHFRAHPGEKYYAQFGRCHVSVITQEEACTWYEYNSIAARLDSIDDDELRGKVCSIAMFYTENDRDERDDDNHKILKDFRGLSQKDGLTLFKLEKDVALEKLSEMYEYVIINNVHYSALQTYGIDYGYPQFAIGAKANHFNYDKLNSFFGNSISKKFNGASTGLNFDFFSITNHSACQRFSFGYYEQNSVRYNDTMEIKLSGYDVLFSVGGDIVKSKVIDLIPSVGYGFGRVSQLTYVKNGVNDPTAGMFGDTLVTKYGNPAVLINAALDLKINLKKVSIGGRIGYDLDISNKHWRKYGILVESSPKTSLSNYVVAVYLAVRLN